MALLAITWDMEAEHRLSPPPPTHPQPRCPTMAVPGEQGAAETSEQLLDWVTCSFP